jgi:hypothetical protein
MVGVSYVDGNAVSQARGYLGSNFNSPFDHQYSFLNDRHEVGTDVFVVGVKPEYANSQSIIILNILEHFMLSIHGGTLEVEVDDDIIDQGSLDTHVEKLLSSPDDSIDQNRASNIKCYLDVLNSPETRVIHLDDSFVRTYPFIDKPEDATFMLLPATVTTTTNRVLMARKSGMKIKEQPFRMGVYFAGVFQATGSGINAFLRTLESAEHRDWLSERADDYEQKKLARKFLNELTVFLRENIRGLIENYAEDTVDAYGLAELLPDENVSESADRDEHEGTIRTDLSKVEIKPTRKVKQQLRYEQEDPEIEDGGDGTDAGEGGRKTPKKDAPGPPKPHPDPPRGGPAKTMVEVHDAMVRLVEKDYRKGMYALRALPQSTLTSVLIKVAASGEAGDYSVQIESVDDSVAELKGNDSIYIPALPAEVLSEVQFKINYDYRLRMKAVLYESK